MNPPLTFIESVDVIIENNIAEPKLLFILSEGLNISSSQIYRKIKQQTGYSPSSYIRTKRLARAYQLIEQTDITLSQIADRVGFQQLAYFSRCFSEVYGYPPSHLRKI